jgi:hypothetical protein
MGFAFGTPPVQVKVNFVAHPGQEEIAQSVRKNFSSDSPASIIELICSRGWGKTIWFGCDVLVPYLDSNPNAKVMWVAPTYQIGMTLIDDVFRGIDESSGEPFVPEFDKFGNRVWEFVTTKSGPILKWWNGATVYIKSADSPDSIVSKGFNRIIIDEAALIDERVFNQQILGTARKAGIKIFLITTPRGKKHWTYKFFLKGQDINETEYISFQQPYTKNPYFNKTLAKIIKDIPEWIYKQEYLAEFIDDGDCVIKGLEHILFGPEIEFPSQQQEWPGFRSSIPDVRVKTFNGEVLRRGCDRRFIVAMDIAKSVDYTVLFSMDAETGEVVYYRRLNKTDYRDVLKLATDICYHFNQAELIFDATGVGAGLSDMLNNFDVIAHPFIFTNDSKTEVVNKLIVSIEYQEIKLPNIVTIKNELSALTYSLTRTGKISYAAAPGFHDDIPMALALANWFRKENSGNDQVGVLEDIDIWNAGDDPKRTGSWLDQWMNDND